MGSLCWRPDRVVPLLSFGTLDAQPLGILENQVLAMDPTSLDPHGVHRGRKAAWLATLLLLIALTMLTVLVVLTLLSGFHL